MGRGEEIKKSKQKSLCEDWLHASQVNYLVEKIIRDINEFNLNDKSFNLKINMHLRNLVIESKKLSSSAKA